MANVWINEFHYDNGGAADANEFIEIAGLAGTNLTGWKIQLYNGNSTSLKLYQEIALSSVLTDVTGTGFGFFSVDAAAMQNGGTTSSPSPDGIALVDASGTVVEFLSYEGVFVAADGAAAGMTSTDVGVFEDGTGSVTGSIQRQGSGRSSSDFNTWAVFATDGTSTRDAANAGQTFEAPSGDQILDIAADLASASEGNSGTKTFTFTVTRSNASGDVSVDWVLSGIGGAGQASTDDFDGLTSGKVEFTGTETTKTITVTVKGDTAYEGNEAFSVTLSNATPGVTIGTATATSTILNDDPLPIYMIQGHGHTSDQVGKTVMTTGVITAIQMTGTTRGFYVQDVNGDGDATTSDAIFVFRGSSWTPNVEIGDAVTVNGKVAEYRSSSSPADLTLTQFGADATVTVTSKGNALPDAVVIGPHGITPPTGDAAAAAAFFESLEGMRVTVEPTRVVGATNSYGEIWALIEGTYDESILNGRGGLPNAADNYHLNRIQFDNIRDSLALPMVDVGARLGTATGIMTYGFSSYEVLLDSTPVVTAQSPLQAETTNVTAWNPFFLSFGTYNVENLDPNDNDGDADVDSGHFAKVARHIVENMGAPNVIALQEIQDDSGSVDNGIVSADKTLQKLVDTIVAAGGPRYKFAYMTPENNKDGGQTGGNIRQAFLYNDDVVDLVPGSLQRIVDPDPAVNDAFQASRKPLVAKFTFNGEEYTFINNHLNSKGGDDPVFGTNNPPVLNSEVQRIEQAKLINAYVDGLLAFNANANVVVLGDMNDFSWSNPLKTLSGESDGSQVLFNLADEFIADARDRTDYVYNGVSQSLDHMYVSAGLRARIEAFDIVRTNSEFDDAERASDHDPLVARSTFEVMRGTEAANLLTGTDQSNAIIGAGGGDLLNGKGGADYLQGDAGNDTLVGGSGADGLYGGDGTDTASYADAGAGVVASLINQAANTGDAAGDIFNSIEILVGSAFADTLTGDNLANTLNGGAGADQLEGGNGDDTYLVDDVGDRVIDASGYDTVLTVVDYTAGIDIEVLRAADAGGGISLKGNDLGNILIGNGAANRLSGGRGADSLTGGAGKDSFVFDTKPAKTEIDKIIDFSVKDDTILLDNAIFKKLGKGTVAKPGKLNKDYFAKDKAKDDNDYLIYDTKKGTLSYDVDGSGKAKAIVIATLDKGLKQMSAADFLVI
ncbi:endonuclease/exonuclease/phosphatase family protein [Microvirga flavescens]|uniref:endonuclease/exonuclease/phosphatase family protein n=1 Tax=Microvirga flavescens TaxID=2249811 RepID=UPI000DD6ED8F|nr:endonuclease/exonuclease/phosphatase family protein [Microvirga flavescens]